MTIRIYKAKTGTKEFPYFESPQSAIVTSIGVTIDKIYKVKSAEETFNCDFKVAQVSGEIAHLEGIGWVHTSYLTLVKELKTERDRLMAEMEDIASAINEDYINVLNKKLPGLDGASAKAMIDRIESGLGTLDVSTRLFGQPFQFNEATDFRINEEGYGALGRKYVETFVAEAPIVHIIPGVSSFLPGMSDDDRNSIVDFFKADAGNKSPETTKFLEEMLAGESRYFEFVSTYVNYMRYVNLMCRASSVYMGLGDTEVLMDAALVHRKYQYFDWKNYKYSGLRVRNDENEKTTVFDNIFNALDDLKDENLIKETAKSILGLRNGVQFYVDPSTSFQESSSNSTTTSHLSSLFESGQGFAKEYHFYSAFADSDGGGNAIMSGLTSGASGLLDTMGNVASGGLMGKLFGATKSIINGGNVILPDIWADSSYQKSYSVTVNLVSPYGTKESVYLHVLVPLFHLMALAAPRQIAANGFAHPFMVKVSCKGWFNCEMGIVDSISIEKVQGSYTVNGIPTEVKVSLSIRDLYSELMVTSAARPDLFVANRGLTNWLAVTSGIDITSPAIQEKWETIMKMLLMGVATGVTDGFDSLKEKMQNILSTLFYV